MAKSVEVVWLQLQVQGFPPITFTSSDALPKILRDVNESCYSHGHIYYRKTIQIRTNQWKRYIGLSLGWFHWKFLSSSECVPIGHQQMTLIIEYCSWKLHCLEILSKHHYMDMIDWLIDCAQYPALLISKTLCRHYVVKPSLIK